MAFNGSEGGRIELETASEWTSNFRNANSGAITAHAFGKDIISQILSQSDCMGIRMYNAVNDSGENTLILAGYDAEGNDLYNGVLGDFSLPCPESCSSTNPLNS